MCLIDPVHGYALYVGTPCAWVSPVLERPPSVWVSIVLQWALVCTRGAVWGAVEDRGHRRAWPGALQSDTRMATSSCMARSPLVRNNVCPGLALWHRVTLLRRATIRGGRTRLGVRIRVGVRDRGSGKFWTNFPTHASQFRVATPMHVGYPILPSSVCVWPFNRQSQSLERCTLP